MHRESCAAVSPDAGVRAGVHRLTVLDVQDVTRLVRRVLLAAPTLAPLPLSPGQDVGLMLTDPTGRAVRRRYTLTRVDPVAATVVLDGIRHGPGPGADWFGGASVGDEVEVFGPRGKITPPRPGAFVLFVGDESALPAFAELAAALPSRGQAVGVVEVADATEELPVPSPAALRIDWVHRDGRPGGGSDLLARALAAADLPGGPGQAYLFGESRAVVALRPILAGRGLAGPDVLLKGYWNATGRRAAVVAEPPGP